ncbi:MAG: hypothetical protein WDN06_20815 [Asticcacaulis sp.]
MTDPEAELEAFIARFLPEVAAVGREAVAKLRAWLPEADVLVYDNYNALAVGFGAVKNPCNPSCRSPFIRAGAACSCRAGSMIRKSASRARVVSLAISC